MNTDIDIEKFGVTVTSLLVLGSALKNAFPQFPNRWIPLVTWVLGLLAYVTITNGWGNPQQWLAGVVASITATGLHSGVKNSLETKPSVPIPPEAAKPTP